MILFSVQCDICGKVKGTSLSPKVLREQLKRDGWQVDMFLDSCKDMCEDCTAISMSPDFKGTF